MIEIVLKRRRSVHVNRHLFFETLRCLPSYQDAVLCESSCWFYSNFVYIPSVETMEIWSRFREILFEFEFYKFYKFCLFSLTIFRGESIKYKNWKFSEDFVRFGMRKYFKYRIFFFLMIYFRIVDFSEIVDLDLYVNSCVRWK